MYFFNIAFIVTIKYFHQLTKRPTPIISTIQINFFCSSDVNWRFLIMRMRNSYIKAAHSMRYLNNKRLLSLLNLSGKQLYSLFRSDCKKGDHFISLTAAPPLKDFKRRLKTLNGGPHMLVPRDYFFHNQNNYSF